jgi:SAM-dependent methyltransferase
LTERGRGGGANCAPAVDNPSSPQLALKDLRAAASTEQDEDASGQAALIQESGSLALNREWKSYEQYAEAQKQKLRNIEALAPNDKRRMAYMRVDKGVEEAVASLVRQQNLDPRGLRVLCLAARMGGEVRAFTQLGALAVGVDLYPGNNNEYVLTGDFHHLQFASNVFDVVFTNSMDHAFDLGAVAREVCRVLVTGGHFYLDIGGVDDTKTGKPRPAGSYETLDISTQPDAVVDRFVQHGMVEVGRKLMHIDGRWGSLVVHFKCF